jgi:hypothetical protein
MAITDETKKAKIFLLLDVPQKTTAFAANVLVSIFGPGGERYTLVGVKDQIDTALAAATTDEETLINLVLTEFDNEWLDDEQVIKDGDSEGVLFSSGKKMNLLRKRVSDLLGVYIPEGGFLAEWRRLNKPGSNRTGSLIT